MVSKTKISAVLIGASAVLGTAAAFLSGNLDFFNALRSIIVEVGGVLFVFGFRDLPFVNKK